MKVVATAPFFGKGFSVKIGDIIETEEATAKDWIENGLAALYEGESVGATVTLPQPETAETPEGDESENSEAEGDGGEPETAETPEGDESETETNEKKGKK